MLISINNQSYSNSEYSVYSEQKHSYLPLWLLFIIISLIGSLGILNDFPRFSWIITALFGLCSVSVSRFFPPLTVVLLFNYLFFIYGIPHIFFNFSLNAMSHYIASKYLTQIYWMISLFLSVLILQISYIPKYHKKLTSYHELSRQLAFPKSPLLFMMLASISYYAIVWGIQGVFILGKGYGYAAYIQNLQSTSGIPEYLLIVFFLGALCAKKPLFRAIWFGLLLFFIIKTSLIGLRVVTMMGGLLALWFSGIRINFKRTLIWFPVFFLLFSFIGVLKNVTSISWEELIPNLLYEVHGDIIVSHHTNVLWSSVSMLYLIDVGILDAYQRINVLLYFLMNMIIPSGILQKSWQPFIGSWLQEQGYSSGGGHIVAFAFLSGGIFFVIFIGFFFGALLRNAVSHRSNLLSQFFRCWFMMTIITFPRWISYDLGNSFFRLPIYASVIYTIIKFIHGSIFKHVYRKKTPSG